MNKYKLNRDITPNECFWLDRDISKGTEVIKYTNYTYGCISQSGIAVSLSKDSPFFELPLDCLDEII